MAMNINQLNIAVENNDAALISVKGANRIESEKKKALGDIKNAPTASNNGGKSTTKKIESEQSTSDSEYFEFASTLAVDHRQAWIEKLALSDEEVNKWMKMIFTPLCMDPAEEIEPPKRNDVDDLFVIPPEPEEPLEIPPPLTDEWESKSPDTTSSEYHSFEGDIEDKMEDDIQPTAENFYNDSEMSRLNQSVFEFSSDSDDIFSD